MTSDAKTLVSAGIGRTIRAWDIGSRTQKSPMTMHDPIGGLAMLDGKGALASTRSGLWLVDLERGKKTLLYDQACSHRLVVSEDRKRIAVNTNGPLKEVLTVIDTATAKPALKINTDAIGDSNSIWGFAFVPRSNLLAIGTNRQLEDGKTGLKDGRLHLYDTSLKRVVAVTEYMPWVDTVAAAPNGDYLASGHFDSSIRVWDLRKPKGKERKAR